MLLDVLMLTPYLAIAASVLVVAVVVLVCLQSRQTPDVSGFGHRERRPVPPYRGATKVSRLSHIQEAA
jgi:hypothetical protein